MRLAILISILVSTLICGVLHADAPFPKITVNGRVGYIVPKEIAEDKNSSIQFVLPTRWSPTEFKKILGYWTPTLEEATKADEANFQFLQSADVHPAVTFPSLKNLPPKDAPSKIKNAKNEIDLVVRDFGKYQCQYAGLLVQGKKIIYCNYINFEAFPPSFAIDLSTRFMDVNDGGHNFWQIEYVVASGKCRNLEINGPWESDR